MSHPEGFSLRADNTLIHYWSCLFKDQPALCWETRNEKASRQALYTPTHPLGTEVCAGWVHISHGGLHTPPSAPSPPPLPPPPHIAPQHHAYGPQVTGGLLRAVVFSAFLCPVTRTPGSPPWEGRLSRPQIKTAVVSHFSPPADAKPVGSAPPVSLQGRVGGRWEHLKLKLIHGVSLSRSLCLPFSLLLSLHLHKPQPFYRACMCSKHRFTPACVCCRSVIPCYDLNLATPESAEPLDFRTSDLTCLWKEIYQRASAARPPRKTSLSSLLPPSPALLSFVFRLSFWMISSQTRLPSHPTEDVCVCLEKCTDCVENTGIRAGD